MALREGSTSRPECVVNDGHESGRSVWSGVGRGALSDLLLAPGTKENGTAVRVDDPLATDCAPGRAGAGIRV